MRNSLRDRIATATAGAPGTVLILSANPMHDTGGGQRSAQIALELLEEGYCVVFVSHGQVTETVDLGLRFTRPRLVETSLKSFTAPSGAEARAKLWEKGVSSVVTQVPVRAWMPVLERASEAGAVTIYDCVDRWDSELGKGWYRREVERRCAAEADVVVASAPELVRRLERMAEREVHLVPNAFNSRVFDPSARYERPVDLPEGRIALYVGALWGGWFDWDLARLTAEGLPDTRFVFIGDHRNEGDGLPSNCSFLGLKPQVVLPAYLAHADVAFLPWRRDDVTQATSPLKVYEFVAMGLPVVAPRLDPLKGIPGVRMVDDDAAFVRAVGAYERARIDEDDRRRMHAFARANSWTRRVQELGGLAGAARAEKVAGGPGSPAITLGGRRTGWPRSRAVISTVIPSYNHEAFIGDAVDSVRAQTLPSDDLVVVDDGSTDGSREVLAERADGRTRVVVQENQGAHEAINRAIALSDGDYVAILNSDDVFHPERLEHAWGIARASEAALVIGGVRWVDEAGMPLSEEDPRVEWYRSALDEARRERSLRRMVLRHNVAVTTSNFFLHRALWRALGGFRDHRYVHDLDFLVRALELCPDRVVFEPSMVDVDYRVHGANTISESTERALAERRSVVRELRAPLGRIERRIEGWRRRGALARAISQTRALRPTTSDEVEGRTTGTGGDGAKGRLSPPRPSGLNHPDAPLRVGLVVRSLGLGGLEETVALLARTLPAFGVSPHVLCTHEGGAVARRLSDAGVSVRVGDGRSSTWRAWMRTVAPMVVSTHFASREVVEVMSEFGTPIVETVQNTYAWFDEDAWAAERDKLAMLAGTVAVSDVVAEYYAAHTGSEPTPHRIPNTVDPARAAAVPRAWARAALGLDASQVVFVHHGRMARQKNLVGLVRAFSEVARSVPRARLILAGPRAERPYFREVRGAAPRLFRDGTIRALPPVPHVGAFLSAADAYVSDSFFEGWSVAASEAAWVGLPLVLSDCGGSRELVGGIEARGRLVPNPLGDALSANPATVRAPPAEAVGRNERALADALADVAAHRDSWQERAPDIREHARRSLSPGGMSRAYASVYRSLVEAAR
ncbi:MAG: glycosyltransferase [Gemmatimonadota bacterium]|nr:glycosyltransferase [Gemmatimonadota bacterium]